MKQKPILPVLRELAKAYQAFESYSAMHVRTMELTPPQFDIIATLGNTSGMPLKELGEKSLITKGTLTGIVDRLTIKKLVRRVSSPIDGRSQIVQLTKKGEALFARIFPAHLAHIEEAFVELSAEDLSNMQKALSQLREVFTKAHLQNKASI
ncbi:MarR family winged helix-turn-helix transcriptional regulator [Sulfurirhabdus autotrophica]|uniref:DNA-binding MarR family transcriptional regulator n=1 Tax=Sulfurirhabdus autotrophica TaxID=1706046 RepID=A0A4R3YBA8_9PROT|nr:MarR family transcriptional regulator [Sulfurirhabdus autotrophica]TCV89011.1 DNA-binding MarR family transcriptional regulator [Sulfurirhabdus autotrophica]